MSNVRCNHQLLFRAMAKAVFRIGGQTRRIFSQSLEEGACRDRSAPPSALAAALSDCVGSSIEAELHKDRVRTPDAALPDRVFGHLVPRPTG